MSSLEDAIIAAMNLHKVEYVSLELNSFELWRLARYDDDHKVNWPPSLSIDKPTFMYIPIETNERLEKGRFRLYVACDQHQWRISLDAQPCDTIAKEAFPRALSSCGKCQGTGKVLIYDSHKG